MFNNNWMIDQGFIQLERFGDLRDLIMRRPEQGAIVTATPADTLLTAYGRMRLYDISQLPVMEGEQIVGILDESDLLLAVYNHADGFRALVRDVMTSRLEVIAPTEPMDALVAILRADRVAIVDDDDRFLGLVTKIDLINHLRQRVA